MNHSELIARLRKACDDVRRKPFPIADLIPLIQETADALQALERVPMMEQEMAATAMKLMNLRGTSCLLWGDMVAVSQGRFLTPPESKL